MNRTDFDLVWFQGSMFVAAGTKGAFTKAWLESLIRQLFIRARAGLKRFNQGVRRTAKSGFQKFPPRM